ncbi:MAG: PaaI family thioesterase [Candidatus Acidiferrales bacterium]
MRLDPNPKNACFGCGGANDSGMKLAFEQDDAARRIRGSFRLGPEYQGGGGILHGGITAVLLDEAMGKVCRFRDARAVTAELTVEYLKPIQIGQEIFVEAFEVEAKGRSLFHQGEIRNSGGDLLARGRGRFVTIGIRDVAAQPVKS